MTGTIKRTTTHYNMRIPIFDAPGWGREIERNLDILDAIVFAATNFSLVKGLWTNSTLYDVGDRVVDEDTNTIWECLVQHTSPATGSFEDARTANPTYWQIVSTIVQNRGVWQTGTTYKYNDFVEFDNKVAVTVVPSYTSGASFDDDVSNGNLHVVIDLEPQLIAASASASAAAASASAAQTSEINAANSAGAASVSAGSASSSASAAASSASAASVSASNAASSASQAASSKTDAEAAKTAAELARDQAQTYRNEALNFRDEAEDFKDDAEAAAAAAATFDPDNFYTKIAADGRFVRFDDAQTLTPEQQAQAFANLGIDPWATLPLRVPIPVFDHLGGGAPPTDKWYRYVKLSAGETGSGGYNEGILTSESVSGSAPYITATAVVSLPDSPLDGQTIPLINTEQRFLRAGTTSGVAQDDEIKQHTHGVNDPGHYHGQQTDGGAGSAGSQAPGNGNWQGGNKNTDFASTGITIQNTGGAETRPRNISATYYMRIL